MSESLHRLNSLDALLGNNLKDKEHKLVRAAQLARFDNTSSLRYVDWRWELCRYLYVTHSKKPKLDIFTKKLYKFCSKLYDWTSDEQTITHLFRLKTAFPDIYPAWQIHHSLELLPYKIELQARVLAQEDTTSICRKLNIDKGVYNWYLVAFFDVENRLNNLSFILWNVIFDGELEPRFENDNNFVKFLGYFFGPAVVDYWIYRVSKGIWKFNDLESISETFNKISESAKNFLTLRFWQLAQRSMNNPDNITTLQKLKDLLQKFENGKQLPVSDPTITNLLQAFSWDVNKNVQNIPGANNEQ